MADTNTTAVTITWLAWGVLVLYLTWKVANWSVAFLLVTSNRMLIIHGLANRKVESMSFATVTDINLQRSVTGRLLGYGELVVEASGQDQAWAKVGFVPFPVQVYNEICLLPDARDPIMRSVMRMQNAFEPVSLFKIVRSLELAYGNQDQDSPSVARERFYSMVADRFQEDESLERRPELRHYLGDYRNYLHRRSVLAFIGQGVIYLVATTLVAALAFYGWRWAKHYPVDPISVVIVVVSVTVPASCLEWVLTQRIRSLGSQSTSAIQRVDQQVSHEFRTLRSELSLDLAQATEPRFDPMLRIFDAPTLIELESPRVQRSASFEYLIEFLQNHTTSAVGVAAQRGAGKSTLLRWVKYELEPKWIVIYLSAPAVYDPADFVRTIFSNTAREVINRRSTVLHQGWLATFIEPLRQRQPNADRQIAKMSQQALASIAGLRSDQRTTMAGISGKGVALHRGRQATWTEREPTHPELIDAYKAYLEQYRWLEGLPIVIAIDELDKLSSVDETIAVVNSLKDLFHIPNTHFIVSVSEDALHRFAMRGIPFRDVFDSAFDTIVKIQPPSPDDALKMLARRVDGFPISVALFCYAWSGALPRDIIRTARSCVHIAKQAGRPVGVAELVPQIIRQDVAEAIDDAIIKDLESKNAVSIDGILSLRHQVRDDNSLQAVLGACELKEAARVSNGTPEDADMLRRLSVYMAIGSLVLEYFSDNISALLADDFGQVLGVVEDLANAKAALATYPAEAVWFLDRARSKMGLHVKTGSHVPDGPGEL